MQARVVDFLLAAGNCFLKAQRQTHLHILAALGTRAPRRSATAESTAENAPENITKIPEIGKAAAVSAAGAGARRRIKRCLAELIVLCLLVRVGQHGVRLVDLLEVLLGIRVAGVQIGVILFGELAVGALDRLRIGVPVYAEYFIVISVFCHMIYTVASAPRSAPCGRCDSFGGAFLFLVQIHRAGKGNTQDSRRFP